MKIALLYLGRRGAGGKISLELARALGPENPILAVLSNQTETLPEWRSLSLERLEVSTFDSAPRALFSLLFPQAIQRLAQQIARWQPDVLLFPMFHPWNALLQTFMSALPAVVLVHDPQPHPDLAGWFYEKLENASLRRASRCVVMSETLRPFAMQRGARAVDTLPLGPLAYPVPTIPPRLPQALFQFFFFGRLVPYKGLEQLLAAYRQVRSAQPCALTLAGSGSLAPYRAALQGLPDVRLINRWIPESEIGSHFASADLVVLPYTSASQSGVIPIAAALALPVIATRVGGLPEQVQDGVSGWLVPPGDVDALAAAMRQALQNPALARQRGLALQARYNGEWNWQRSAQRLLRTLQQALDAETSL